MEIKFTMDLDYKKYSLEKLEDWICDVVDGEATPDEIADVIYTAINNSINYHQKCLDRSREILIKLGGVPNDNFDLNKSYSNKIKYEEVVDFTNYDQAVANGYTMTADGFWIKEEN